MSPWLSITCVFCLLASCGEKEGHVESATLAQQSASMEETGDYSGQNAMLHTQALVEMGPRFVSSEASAQQRAYITKHLQVLGWTVIEETFQITLPESQQSVTMANLRARYGRNVAFEKNLKGVLSCHVDTKLGIADFVGANDGASGIAHLLELARVLTPEQASHVELVFFDGEESFASRMNDVDGLYGSKHYAQKLVAPLPEWAVNFDMVGRRGMKIRIPSDSDQALYLHYQKVLKTLGLKSGQWGVSTGPILDDHVPLQERGIPVLNVIDDFTDGHWWHTSADNMDLLHASSFEVTGRFSLQLLKQLLP